MCVCGVRFEPRFLALFWFGFGPVKKAEKGSVYLTLRNSPCSAMLLKMWSGVVWMVLWMGKVLNMLQKKQTNQKDLFGSGCPVRYKAIRFDTSVRRRGCSYGTIDPH